MKNSSVDCSKPLSSAFERRLVAPGELVASVRRLLRNTILEMVAEAAPKLTARGLVAVHGYEDLASGPCSFACHQKVGRTFLLIRDGARSASLVFGGCANVPAELWMIESHASFDRMPPPCVSRCLNADLIESFTARQISCFLLALDAAASGDRSDCFMGFLEDAR